MNWRSPRFEHMPPELIKQARWVCWKGNKVPFQSTCLNSTASSTDPDTWSSFEQAQTAYDGGDYSGVGFVLNGDGIVGVDLDECVVDGVPSDTALSLLREMGCCYVELSPSGTGLHGFGLAEPGQLSGRRGVLNGLNVEIYFTNRYLTMTGHVLQAGPLAQLHGLQDVLDQISSSAPTEETEVTEEIECNSSVSSDSSVGTLKLPESLFPRSAGQRHHKVFHLARHLKGVMPDASIDALKPIVKEWHSKCLPYINTKEFDITWAEFVNAWHSVKHAANSVLPQVLSELPPIPAGCTPGERGGKAEHLYRVCLALQRHEGEKPFFLACRIAGELVSMHHTDASSLLRSFCQQGFLELVQPGTKLRASRYLISAKWRTQLKHEKSGTISKQATSVSTAKDRGH